MSILYKNIVCEISLKKSGFAGGDGRMKRSYSVGLILTILETLLDSFESLADVFKTREASSSYNENVYTLPGMFKTL